MTIEHRLAHFIHRENLRRNLLNCLVEPNQSAPVLVLSHDRDPVDQSIDIRSHEQTRFINSPGDIRRYLSSQYGVAQSA